MFVACCMLAEVVARVACSVHLYNACCTLDVACCPMLLHVVACVAWSMLLYNACCMLIHAIAFFYCFLCVLHDARCMYHVVLYFSMFLHLLHTLCSC